MERLIVCLILGIFLSGCNKYDRIVPEVQLTEKNDLMYERDAEKAFNGIAVRLYPNGNKYADIHYLNGKRHGRATVYDKKGNIALSGYYTDDEISGEWIHWKDEKITQKEIWKHDRQIQCFVFHDNGQLARECKFEEDSLCMENTFFSKDGKIWAKIVIDIKSRTGKMMISEKKAIKLTLSLSDDKKHWNVNSNSEDKTIARIDTRTYVFSRVKFSK